MKILFIDELLDLDSFKLASIGPYIGVVKIDNPGKIINHIGKTGRGPANINMVYILQLLFLK